MTENSDPNINRFGIPKRKVGAFSNDEREEVRKYATERMPISQIAEKMNRTPEIIKKFLGKENQTYADMSVDECDLTTMRAKLHKKVWWVTIIKILTILEIPQFEKMWIDLNVQFREDVLASEENQIKDFIIFDIFMTRNMVNRKEHLEQIDKEQEELRKEYAKSEGVRDIDKLNRLEQSISFLKNSTSSYTAEHVKLSSEKSKMLDKLKATREARIKTVEDSKSSFAGHLKALENDSLRKRIGDEIELMRLAKDASKERLSEWHEYGDGKLDQPFLTPETVKDE